MQFRPQTLLIAVAIGPLVVAIARADKPPSEAAAKELAKLQGAWLLVHFRCDGKDFDAAKVLGAAGEETKLTFTGNRYVVTVGKRIHEEGMADVDPATLTAIFTISQVAGRPVVLRQAGTYLLKDRLFIACLRVGETAPTTFSAEAGENTELVIYRRLDK